VDRKLDGMTQMLKVMIQRQEEMFEYHQHLDREENAESRRELQEKAS